MLRNVMTVAGCAEAIVSKPATSRNNRIKSFEHAAMNLNTRL